jgi:hypothetical protein
MVVNPFVVIENTVLLSPLLLEVLLQTLQALFLQDLLYLGTGCA